MLGRLVLIALQIPIAWFGAPLILRHIPVTGDPRLFVHAAIFAVLVFLVGVIGSLVLKDVSMPGAPTLTWALVAALVCAALLLVPPVVQAMRSVLTFDRMFLPLAGAVLGYALKK